MRSSAVVDLEAIRANTRHLRELVGPAQVMAVVKADGYGHGAVPSATAALDGGATWLGVAFVEEALELRAAGLTAPVLAWLTTPGDDLAPAVDAGVDLGVPSVQVLERAVAAAGRTRDRTARVQLKVDTGLTRSGAQPCDWPDLCDAAAKAQAEGAVQVTGIWSHLAFGEQGAGHPVNLLQQARFEEALVVAAERGLDPEVRHLANTGAALTVPEARYDLVRIGIGLYGLAPVEGVDLRPAMTLRTQVAMTKRVPAGEGIGYLHRHATDRETTVALVPLGYGDGVPRNATNTAEVLLAGRRRRIAGTVSMDQFSVELGDDVAVDGDEVVLFGPGDRGEPTATEWAAALGTIDYEIVTRIGARVPRSYEGEL